MLPVERLHWIEKQIVLNKKVDIEEVSKKLNVSSMTIRRDLKELEKRGKLIRTHGGAVAPNLLTEEIPFKEKETKNKLQKRLIAKRAVQFVEKDSIIILDSGTTTFEVAKLLKDRDDITVVTNDIIIAYELYRSPVNLIVTGGEVQRDIGSLYGPTTQHMLKNIHANLFFLGAHAVDVDYGVTVPTFEKALIKQMMINAAEKTILLADFSKFNKKTFSIVCSLNDVDRIVTDYDADPILESRYGNKLFTVRGE